MSENWASSIVINLHLLAIATSDSITGTSINTIHYRSQRSTEFSPNGDIATATASSKKLLAPIMATGAQTACRNLKSTGEPGEEKMKYLRVSGGDRQQNDTGLFRMVSP